MARQKVSHNYPPGDAYQRHLAGVTGVPRAPAPPVASDSNQVRPDEDTPSGSKFKNYTRK